MKLKRLGAFLLTLVMLMGMVVTSASAASFSDISGHWAETYIEDVYSQGMVNGYSDGSFGPDNQMTYCEALLFCSRVLGLSSSEKSQVYFDYISDVSDLLPDTVVSWAATEMSYCVAAGIISMSELEAVSDAGDLTRTISRETLAMYLTRAMQLGGLADNLTSYSLNFGDTSSISTAMRPYVYVLNSYGIIQGDENNNFDPDGSLTRAQMATMLSRALDFMTSRGIVTELANYSTSTWAGGYITSITTSSAGLPVVVLTSDFSGARSATIPTTAKVYEYNMSTTSSVLEEGDYVRLNYNSSGTVTSVRIGGSTTSYTGDIVTLTQDEIVLYTDGGYQTLAIDYFTEIQTGLSVGYWGSIDLDAGYVTATCAVDSLGHLASLQLGGGTNAVEGIIADVSYNSSGYQTLQVCSLGGATTRYTVASTAVISNTSGSTLTLSSTHEGDFVSLRTSDTTGEVETMSIDTSSTYLQGSIKYFSVSNETVSIADLESGSYITYDVSDYALLYYEDDLIYDMDDLEKGWFITALYDGSELTALWMYEGDYEVDGTISGITYGVYTVIDVLLDDGSTMTFNIDMTDQPTIYRDDSYTTIDKLRTGDEVTFDVDNCEVDYIYAYPQSANVSGTISKITLDSTGAIIELLVGSTTETYDISSSVTVTWDDDVLSVNDLKPDYTIGLVVMNGQVVSIEIDSTTTSSTKISGTVYSTDTSEYTIMLGVGTSIYTVYTYGANFSYASSGSTTYLKYLEVNDTIDAYGYYSGTTFVAHTIMVY